MRSRGLTWWLAVGAVTGIGVAVLSGIALVLSGYLIDEQVIRSDAAVFLFFSLGAGAVVALASTIVLVAVQLRR